MMTPIDIDGRLAQGWGGSTPNGTHVNVLLAQRGSATAATIMTAFTSPAPGFTPILACLGPDQASYVTLNPPTVIVNKTEALTGLQQTLVSGGAQVGIAQGVLDAVADGVVEPDQETIILVSLWIDPAAEDETKVRTASREATAHAVREAVTGRSDEERHALVNQRDHLTHPFYGGN